MADKMSQDGAERQFEAVPEHVVEDLTTLEIESAVYANHWIDELQEFRHVRIQFTKEEQEEYVRRAWAYELFLRAGQPEWASETPGIDKDIAKEADEYKLQDVHGNEFGPPYHCFAAFLGQHLEWLTCSGSERQTVIALEGRQKMLFEVERAIKTLTPTIRSFRRREKGLIPWRVTCEDDVRDLLFAMIRPILWDLGKEVAVPPVAGRHRFVDLCSEGARLMIELKWIDKPGAWRKRVDEIHVDVQVYAAHPACENLFFVIVDAIKDVQDPIQLGRQLTGSQIVRQKVIDVKTLVCET